LILAIEAIHVAFVFGCVDVSFAHGEECGGQELFQPWWRHQHQFLRKTNTDTVICSGQGKNMCVCLNITIVEDDCYNVEVT